MKNIIGYFFYFIIILPLGCNSSQPTSLSHEKLHYEIFSGYGNKNDTNFCALYVKAEIVQYAPFTDATSGTTGTKRYRNETFYDDLPVTDSDQRVSYKSIPKNNFIILFSWKEHQLSHSKEPFFYINLMTKSMQMNSKTMSLPEFDGGVYVLTEDAELKKLDMTTYSILPYLRYYLRLHSRESANKESYLEWCKEHEQKYWKAIYDVPEDYSTKDEIPYGLATIDTFEFSDIVCEDRWFLDIEPELLDHTLK